MVDLSGEMANSTVKITVTPALNTSFHANRTFISADQAITFTNVTTGGTGSNVYSWSINPTTGVVVGSHGSVTFNTAGNYVASFSVNDLSGEVASAANILIQVTPPLTANILANRTFISADQWVAFTNSSTGGTGSNVYTFKVTPNSGFIQSGNKLFFTVAGNYLITINVTDLSGEKANATAKITVTPPLTLNVTANRTFISADQKVHFTNSTTGGTGSNVYSYNITPKSGFVIDPVNKTIQFNSAANYTIKISVTDLSGEQANTTIKIQVTPPLVTNLTANRTFISADQWVSFANVTSGGTGSNVYTLAVSPNSGFSRNGNKIEFTAAGNYIVKLNVTDLSGEKANASVKVQVTPPLTINVSANRTFISADQYVSFANSTHGGTGSNVYNFSVSPNSGFTKVGNKLFFTVAGNYTVKVSVVDLSGETANATVKVQVTPPLNTSLHANVTFISADQQVAFTNVTTGGTGSNVYTLTFKPSTGVVHVSGGKYQFNAPGNYVITLNVTDLSGEAANSSVHIQVTPALNTTLHANRTLISADQAVTFTNTTTGGTGSNVYTFKITPSTGFTIGSHGSVEFTSPGNYVVTLNVTDLSGEKASSANVIIIVTPALTTQLNANRTFISADQKVHFSNSTTGGTGTNTYTFTFNNTNGIVHTNDGNYQFNNAGNYLATLNVVDISGEKANSSVKITVTPPLNTTIHANRTFISADQAIHFTNTTTGGTGSNVYSITFSPSTGVVHISDGRYSFNTAGNYVVTETVSDITGEVSNSIVHVTVTPPLTINLTANKSFFISADQHLTFINFTTGGTGSNVYTYTVNRSSGWTRNGNNFNFTAPGQYNVTIHVTDLSGEAANASAHVSVTKVFNVTLTANRTFISADQAIHFTNGFTGGTGNNVFTLVFNNTNGIVHNSDGIYTFNTAGKYSVHSHATDFSVDTANSSTIIITVTPPLTINLTANKTFISADQVVHITNHTTGGTGSNVFTTVISPTTGVVHVSDGRYQFNTPGNYLITVSVVDLSGETANASVHIIVTPPLNVTLHANVTLISADQKVHFSNVTTGGTGTNHYTLTISPSTGVVHQTDGNYMFNNAGNYIATLTVTDISGEVATSANVLITVTPPLVTQLNANVTFISADQKVHFTNTTSGGTGSNVFTFSINPTTGVVHNSDGIYTFNQPGNYIATLNVTDISGEFASSNVLIQVTPPLTANITVNRTFISADQKVQISTSTTGGTGSNVYTFKITPNSGFTQNGNVFTFTVPGNYLASFTVNDISGEVATSKNVTITVTPVLTLNLTANRTFISADQSVSFSNSTTGGTGSNVYTNFGAVCRNADSVVISNSFTVNGNVITFTKSGICIVTLNVTDLSGETANALVKVTVTPPLTLNLTANRTYISEDQSVSVSNVTKGGTGSNVYSYSVSPNSGFVQNGNVFTFNNAGNYTVTLNVTDLSGEKANASVKIQVTPPLTINLTANRTLISVGQGVKLTNVTSGGTGSNHYYYSIICVRNNETVGYSYAISNSVVNLTEVGTCHIKIYVRDLSGERANASVNVTVTPPLTVDLIANTSFISAYQSVSLSYRTYCCT